MMGSSRPNGGKGAEALWAEIDRFLESSLLPEDPVLSSALAESARAGLPPIQVSPTQGRLLQLLARALGARNILEIGTLGGYSSIWLARALPEGGKLVTLELDPRHAELARRNLERAGLLDRVMIRRGAAIESLPRLAEEGLGPFDLTFIDADKESTLEYFRHALALSRPGGLIVVDNVVREGAVGDAATRDPSAQGIRRFLAEVCRMAGVEATAIQTVGSKGYDGFLLARVPS